MLEFAASSLTGSGAITPAATATITATTVTTTTGSTESIYGPEGLAFDKSGDLWVANWTSDNYGSLAEFTRKQLAAVVGGGSPVAVGSATDSTKTRGQTVVASSGPSPKVFLDSNPTGSNIDAPLLITFGPSVR